MVNETQIAQNLLLYLSGNFRTAFLPFLRWKFLFFCVIYMFNGNMVTRLTKVITVLSLYALCFSYSSISLSPIFFLPLALFFLIIYCCYCGLVLPYCFRYLASQTSRKMVDNSKSQGLFKNILDLEKNCKMTHSVLIYPTSSY